MEGTSGIGFWEGLEMADKSATLAINSVNSPVSDWIWQFFSDKEVWYPLYLGFVIYIFMKMGWRKALVVTLACVLTIVACDQFSNFCKEFFARLRPCVDPYMLENGLHMLEGVGNQYGFYSAHAANAMGFASSSLVGLKADSARSHKVWPWFICIWAFLVGISRIFVGKHFLGDVIVGLMVGALFGWLLASAGCWVIRRFSLK